MVEKSEETALLQEWAHCDEKVGIGLHGCILLWCVCVYV